MTDNREQLEYWNGAGGARWVTHQVALDRMVGPFGEAAMRRLELRPGEHVLDVGCGCGDTMLALAQAVGAHGSVTGIDLSAPMVELARKRNPGATVIAADAVEHGFDRTFDAMFSRFGVMFFADPVAAFRRLHGLLTRSPIGRVAFACWRSESENTWASVPFAAVRSVLPDAQLGVQDRSTGPGPFAFADRELVARMLIDAGFSEIAIERFDTEVEVSRTGLQDAVRFALTAGPAARLLAQASAIDKQRAAVAVGEALAGHLVGQRVALRGAAWTVLARRGWDKA